MKEFLEQARQEQRTENSERMLSIMSQLNADGKRTLLDLINLPPDEQTLDFRMLKVEPDAAKWIRDDQNQRAMENEEYEKEEELRTHLSRKALKLIIPKIRDNPFSYEESGITLGAFQGRLYAQDTRFRLAHSTSREFSHTVRKNSLDLWGVELPRSPIIFDEEKEGLDLSSEIELSIAKKEESLSEVGLLIQARVYPEGYRGMPYPPKASRIIDRTDLIEKAGYDSFRTLRTQYVVNWFKDSHGEVLPCLVNDSSYSYKDYKIIERRNELFGELKSGQIEELIEMIKGARPINDNL